MCTKRTFLPLFVSLVVITSSFNYNNKSRHDTVDKWSGTIAYTRTSKDSGYSNENGVKHEWKITSAYKVTATFTNNKGTAERSDTSASMNRNTSKFTSDKNHVEERNTEISCSSNGAVEVKVEIEPDTKTYWISFSPPSCQETVKSSYTSNLYPSTNSTTTEENPGTQINIPDQKLGNNPGELSGTIEEKLTDPGGVETITIITWHLKKGR